MCACTAQGRGLNRPLWEGDTTYIQEIARTFQQVRLFHFFLHQVYFLILVVVSNVSVFSFSFLPLFPKRIVIFRFVFGCFQRVANIVQQEEPS